MEFTDDYNDIYMIKKESRVKIVKGLRIKSGRTVRHGNLNRIEHYIGEGVYGPAHCYSYEFTNNSRYTDNSKDYLHAGCADCDDKSHLCLFLVKKATSEYGRNLKLHEYIDLDV